MTKLEEFADVGRHPRNTFEGKMARAYREAVEDLESAENDHENPVPQLGSAERRLAEIESDIENFMDIVGSYSRHDIAHRLNRCKLDVVQAAFAKRDTIIAELKPVIAELTKKLMKAEEILVKYG